MQHRHCTVHNSSKVGAISAVSLSKRSSCSSFSSPPSQVRVKVVCALIAVGYEPSLPLQLGPLVRLTVQLTAFSGAQDTVTDSPELTMRGDTVRAPVTGGVKHVLELGTQDLGQLQVA